MPAQADVHRDHVGADLRDRIERFLGADTDSGKLQPRIAVDDVRLQESAHSCAVLDQREALTLAAPCFKSSCPIGAQQLLLLKRLFDQIGFSLKLHSSHVFRSGAGRHHDYRYLC